MAATTATATTASTTTTVMSAAGFTILRAWCGPWYRVYFNIKGPVVFL
jgi:putative component of toxin-antitoxin plasmid stabilization module